MPGLLQTGNSLASLKFVAAFLAELLGVMLFTLYGSVSGRGDYAAWGNGIALAVLVYATANVSGGHLNPAVTIATMVSGHIGPVAGVAYLIAQISGACLGILLEIGLLPGYHVGMGNGGLGCFTPSHGLTRGMAFGWEAVMTFVLVAVVYAVAIGKPSFSETGPLAVGFSLWASAIVAGDLTGASLNPARTLGPTFVFHCDWRTAWAYVLGELLGGIIAGLISWPLYGTAGPWARAVLRPLTSTVGPVWHRAGDKFQDRVDKLPPGVASFFSLTATKKEDGVPNDDGGDEEQGGNSGDKGGNKKGDKNNQGQKRQQANNPNRGMLKGPGTPDQSPQQNGHYANQHEQQYVEQPYAQPSYEDYESGYTPQYAEPLVRSPSINMDWQTLRGPARGGRR